LESAFAETEVPFIDLEEANDDFIQFTDEFLIDKDGFNIK